MAERLKFIAPIVVDEDVESTLPTNDEINSRPYNPPTSEESFDPKPEAEPPVIEPAQETTIFTVVEEAPSFPGGEEARIRFLKENIRYPEEAKQLGIQGKVYITFVVETDGSITDIKILRGIGAGCDEEAIRVIKQMPNWIPGKQRAHPVRVQFNLPISFILL